MISLLPARHKMMAYVLNKEFNYTQTAIATLMKVSQPTISQAIKESTFMIQINNLEKLYSEVRYELESQGFIELPEFNEVSFFDKRIN